MIEPNQPFSSLQSSEEKEDKQLELNEAKFKIKKLRREIKYLDYQNSKQFVRIEWLKALSGIGSVLTALVALGTIVFSIAKWTGDNSEAREQKNEEKFSKTIAMLQDASSQKRNFATIELLSYVTPENKSRNLQIVMALTTALAYETDETTRSAIIDFFQNFPIESLDSTAKIATLNSLINLNRSITTSEGLINLEALKKKDAGMAKDTLKRKLIGLDQAIKALFSKGVLTNNLSNLFLVEMDFSKYHFLENTDFSNSVLLNCKFDNAVCLNCNFTDANISSTYFRNANLQNSRFGFTSSTNAINYIIDGVLYQEYYLSPNFEGADLRNANFKHFPLINYGSMFDPRLYPQVMGLSFESSNISGANFDRTIMYSIQSKKKTPAFSYYTGAMTGYRDCTITFEIFSDRQNAKGLDEHIIRDVLETFEGSNWKEAKLPAAIIEIMSTKNEDDY